jgi:DNA-binding MarR family transcriptional regulator
MKLDSKQETLVLKLWYMIHHIHDLLKVCEDRVFPEYGITTEQYVVLITVKYGHVRPTDIARWLARSPNSISMIADRMVKAGLIKRIRDRSDRRVVRLVITSKGENALRPAHRAGWGLVREILSPLSYEDKQTLLRLLFSVQEGATKHLNPGADLEAIRRNEAEHHADLFTWLIQYTSPGSTEAEHQAGQKRKTVRRG